MVAVLAKPALDPDKICPLFIFGFTLVVAMPDEAVFLSTLRTTIGTNTILVLLPVYILLLVASIIG